MTVVAAERTAALLKSLSTVDVPQHQEDSAFTCTGFNILEVTTH